MSPPNRMILPIWLFATISGKRWARSWVIDCLIDSRPRKPVHRFRQICFLSMRRKRECYLLIREIRVASSWEAMDGCVFRRRRVRGRAADKGGGAAVMGADGIEAKQ